MLWSTNSGISFFGGFGRLPLPPGKKGCAIGLLLAAGLVVILFVLAYLFALAGVVAFAIGALVLTWRPLRGLEKKNRAREAAIRLEQREAASEDDTEFRVP